MRVTGSPRTVRIYGTATNLTLLVASMKANTWAQLSASNQDATLYDTGNTGTSLPYSNAAAWNPITRQVEIIGNDHGSGATPNDLHHFRYDDATNSYVTVSRATGLLQSHGEDHTVVNPSTGDLYVTKYGLGSPLRVAKYNSPGNWTDPFTSTAIYVQVARGACWWSGTFTGGSGHGAQGSFMVYDMAFADGLVAAWDPLTDNWFFTQSPITSGSVAGHSCCMEYSAVHNVALMGGGNGQETKVWRLNSDGTATAMPDCPTNISVNEEALGTLTVDPVTGNFLVLAADQLWELDPRGSGAWNQLANTPANTCGSFKEHRQASSISTYGAVMLISQQSASGGSTWIYKRADYFALFSNLEGENPISDSSKWVNGQVTGSDWKNVKVLNGAAVGTAYQNPGIAYDDSICHLATSIDVGSDYRVTAKVYRAGGYSPSGNHEIEILGRFSITNGVARGYEILWQHANQYAYFVRWNGPEGDFTIDPGWDIPFGASPQDGDIVRVDFIGSTVSVYLNGAFIKSFTDSTWATGQPGMGFWAESGATVENMGWKDFLVESL